MRTPALLFTLALGACFSTAAPAATAKANDAACDTKWEELSEQYVRQKTPADYPGLLAVWKKQNQCADSERYKARLALTYFFLHQLKEAQAALSSVKGAPPHDPLVELVQIFVDITAPPPPGSSNEHFKQIEQRLRTYVNNNPKDIAGIGLLGDVLSQNGRYDSAIELYRLALKGTGMVPRAAGLARNLTITLTDAERYQEAYDIGGSALALDQNLTSDLYFICAVGRTLASLGKIEDAKNSLTLLAAKRPEVQQNPAFQAAVAFVKEKIAAAK